MRPLGLSFCLLTTPAPMVEAGGRLFVDVTARLASPTSRAALLEVHGAGRSADPGCAADHPRTRRLRPAAPGRRRMPPAAPARAARRDRPDRDRSGHRRRADRAQPGLRRHLEARDPARSGSDLLDFILADIQELRRLLFDPQSTRVFMSAMEAASWLNEHLLAWLGEKNAADTLTQSVPHNITSEMGLALLDVADVIRPHPEVVAFLEHVEDEDFLDELAALDGGREARDAIRAWLDRYGMRCVGEIDITKPRWSERPSDARARSSSATSGTSSRAQPNGASSRGGRRHEQKEQELLERLRALPDGERKAAEAKSKIDRVRTFIGYREYPKYGMVSRYFVYKQALLEEGRAPRAGTRASGARRTSSSSGSRRSSDVVHTQQADDELIRERKEAFASFQALTPPRVLTSDGEAVAGTYRRDDVPAGALLGLAVSAGTVEGRARVILDMAEADLEAGDILVTAFTDPSWTPLFVAITGLVTEVGGLMTHGAVIAREYGLPAVVGVENATRLIRDGQRIRVHGTDGYVEILP